MAKPSWIRAEDGDWYRASEVVAVKTMPHNPDGGFMVTVETHRHDNIDVTGRLDQVEDASRCRDALVRLLATAEKGVTITYASGGFSSEEID
ncbi:hypothetical protein [Actinomycetospora lemnae]|uniref:DUF2188 domain-containing protein n=1 Tax=Actinomycetospora lemnae TaxID=3019891 RepID=A0ABT5SX92_9PSEU|nr:hypothetical protein [Actinomycetospora sp. DW7H6]MDD7966766.1 hypothetical protein [Actinomycetospora sp. DW7H6]